jgi:uncharacterized membrane protein YccC
MEHGPLEAIEHHYHLVVVAGYALVIAAIVAVMHIGLMGHIGLWLLGIAFFAMVMSKTRKGLEPQPKFEV